MTNEEYLWDVFEPELGGVGAAAVIANFTAESGLKPDNLQNSYERKFGMTDEEYTSAVDSGEYSGYTFSRDGGGYGLAQWTHWSRKEKLYDYAKTLGVSIGELDMQAKFALKELHDYGLTQDLKKSGLRDAVATVLRRYEKPSDQSDANVERRYKLAVGIYERHAHAHNVKQRLRDVLEELAAIINEM